MAAVAGNDPELIVCGGQAVSFWAQRHGLHPVVSRDLDLLGDREAAQRIAAQLGAAIQYPGRYDMTVLTAVVRAVWRGRPLTIECLSSVPGIETDPEAISERVDLGACGRLRVLHPMALVLAKLHAVRFFEQAERHDEAHLRLVWTVAGRWLAELAATEAPRALRLVHLWHRTARQPANRRILDRLELDWKGLVPLAALRLRSGEEELAARFLAEHWPRLANS